MAKECCKTVKKEFHSHKLLLGSKHPEKFVRAECIPQNVYLAWRLIWVAYHCGAIITSGILEQHYASTVSNRVKWFIFLTNWAYLTLTLSAIVDFSAVLYFRLTVRDNINGKAMGMPWFLKVVWALFNISNAMGIEISIIYWTLLHDSEQSLSGYKILPFLTHGMNSIYIITNLFVTGIPVRIFHFWQPLTFGFVYGLFSMIYTLSGGTDDTGNSFIYSILDWKKKPGLTVGIITGAAISSIFLHVLVYLFYRIREILAKILCKRNESVHVINEQTTYCSY